uniref:Uncharacterized protein n=1 Tax=Globisporangium ultimum (strain ATCC 200006 / CBS 805.95 / DAOM BR144) TaxID=431595 RepID=K3X4A7_GLOUD
MRLPRSALLVTALTWGGMHVTALEWSDMVDDAATAALAATCSVAATASWQGKCAARTSSNKDLLPLTNMDASEINIDVSNIVDTYESARLTALKLSGAAGNAAMSGMRKKTKTWYETSLRNMMTYFCVEMTSPEELDRCVEASSPDAALDITGQCIKLTEADSCSSKGMCERESNCKWDDAEAGTSSRRELFTADNVTTATKWMEKGYPSSLAPFAAPGIVFAVLTSLAFVGFIVLRCIFNQCGGRNPKEKGYTRCDILIPSVIFMVCTLAVFICSVVTIAQNSNISDGVNGILNSLNVTLVNIDIFASNLQAPLIDAESQIQSAATSVSAQVQGLEWIATDGEKLHRMIQDYNTIYSTQGPFPSKTCNTNSTSCIACPDTICGSPLNAFVSSAFGIASDTSGIMASSVQSLQYVFVNKSKDILTGIRTANMEISGVETMTKRSKEVVTLVKETFDEYSFSRGALVFSVFFFGLISSLLGAFAIFKGVCTKKSAWVHMLHVSWILGTLVCILGFVLSASLLAVGAVWYDSCNYMNIMQADVSPYVPRQMATIVNACFNDSSILQPLKLEDQIAFSCYMDDTYTKVKSTDFSSFKTLTSAYGVKVSDYGLRDFGFDSATSRDLLSKLNAAVADVNKIGSKSFTQENVVTPWVLYSGESPATFECDSKNLNLDDVPICFMKGKCESGTNPASSKDKCTTAFTNAYNYVLSFNKISDMIDTMREDLLGDTGKGFSDNWNYTVSIMEFADDYFSRLATVRKSTIDTLMQSSGVVGKLLETVERLRCSQSCGWINISFNAVHDSLCTNILGTTLAISLCVLFLCIFLIPMIVTGITLQKRLRGAKKGTYEQLERRLQALEIKTKEEARAKAEANKASPSKKIDLFKLKKNTDSA